MREQNLPFVDFFRTTSARESSLKFTFLLLVIIACEVVLHVEIAAGDDFGKEAASLR